MTRKTATIILACLAVSACDHRSTYDSIWKRVYGETPPYQDKIEAMELKTNDRR